MTVAEVTKDTEVRMGKAIDALHNHLNSVRTGRATPALVEDVRVDYYGSSMPLNQLASISAPESRLLVIQPWDKGSTEQRRPGDPPEHPGADRRAAQADGQDGARLC
jgi:ribosome recycling factor